jgi:ABC-type transport system involved in cytochrome bd biosynthesis fused ATPase/permease subunit
MNYHIEYRADWKTCTLSDITYQAHDHEADFDLIAVSNTDKIGVRLLKARDGDLWTLEDLSADDFTNGLSRAIHTRLPECNVITLRGPSGCGKSTFGNTIESMCRAMGYTAERIRFDHVISQGLPSITFNHPLGMLDLHNCLTGYASKTRIGETDQ